jgi:protein MpaA
VPIPTPGGNLVAGAIGTSQAGRPLSIYQLGTGPHAVIVVGGIDGGTEGNTTALVEQLIDTLAGQPSLVPSELTLLFVPAANPDGVASGVRWLNDGVDENRNWPTADWATDTYVSGPTFIAGGGGTAPFSEPETRDLAAFVQQVRPEMIVSYHSAAGLVMSGPAAQRLGLDALYANVVGYPAGVWTAYPVTGDFAQWAEDRGIPTIEIELPDHSTTDFDDNLGAFEAVLVRMAAGH